MRSVWINDPKNDVLLGQERAFLERTIRNEAYRVRRLARSLDRPMCVGVFGPSQAGKSYLVSVIGRKGETLTALFDDRRAPGSRFHPRHQSLRREGGDRPCHAILHRPSDDAAGLSGRAAICSTQTDVLKILCNSYFFDGDLERRADAGRRRYRPPYRRNSTRVRP